jgi:hypothetical protein
MKTVNAIIFTMVFFAVCAWHFSVDLKYIQKLGRIEKQLRLETKALIVQTKRVAELEEMVARDDLLLDQFMHGSWKRGCDYELVPGVLLADGSIRSSLIQKCEEDK